MCPAQPSQAGADAEQAGGLAVHQFHAIGFGHVDAADALQLQEFAFHHHLRQADQQVQHLEIALAQRDLEGLHVHPVAGQHAGVVAPLNVGGRTAATRLRGIDHIVVHQSGRMNQFDDGAQLNRRGSTVTDQFGGEQEQGGAQPFSAGRLQVLADGGDGVHRRHRFHGDLLFHLLQVVLDQVENLPSCQRLSQLA